MKKTESTLQLDISTATIVRFFVIGGLVALLWKIHATVLVIFVAVVLSVFIEHMAKGRLLGRLPRVAATLIVYVLFVGIVSTIIAIFIPTFLQETSHMISAQAGAGDVASVFKALSSSNNPTKIVSAVQNQIQDFSPSTWSVVLAGFGGIVNVMLVLVLSLYLSIERNAVERLLRVVLPKRLEDAWISVWRRSERKIARWFSGQLVLAAILALFTYFGLWLVDTPYALIIALFAAVMSLVPFGIVIAGVCATLLTLINATPMAALFMVIWFVVLRLLEDYILLPLITRRSAGVPALVSLLALAIGVALFGIVGLILAVPAVIIILEIMKDYQEKKEREHSV